MTKGERIKARREELGITQVALADMIGESKQTVYKYESGLALIRSPLVNLIHLLFDFIISRKSYKSRKKYLDKLLCACYTQGNLKRY